MMLQTHSICRSRLQQIGHEMLDAEKPAFKVTLDNLVRQALGDAFVMKPQTQAELPIVTSHHWAISS